MMANSGEKIIYSNFIVSIVIVIYRIILDFSYVSIVSPLYSSNGLINFYTITNFASKFIYAINVVVGIIDIAVKINRTLLEKE